MFRPQDGSPPIVGVVGTLQLDVPQTRLAGEYDVGIGFESTPFSLARWMDGDKAKLAAFVASNCTAMADDLDGDPMFLASSTFMMRRTLEMNADLRFVDIKQISNIVG